MAQEDFTSGWTETDPDGHISETSSRITWAGMGMDKDQFVARDASPNLNGDFDIIFEVYCNSSSDPGFVPQCLSLGDATESFWIVIDWGETGTDKIFVGLNFFGTTPTQDTNSTTLVLDTNYFCRLKRDYDGGAGTGSATLDFYANDANRAAETSKILTLSINLSDQKTLTIVHVPGAYDDGHTPEVLHSGYLQNLDLAYVVAGVLYPEPERVNIIKGRSKFWGRGDGWF